MLHKTKLFFLGKTILLIFFLTTCGVQPVSETVPQATAQTETKDKEYGGERGPGNNVVKAEFTEFPPIALGQGEKLRVLATTNIVGDLVGNVAGDLIELSIMLPPGADPHTFLPAPQDVVAVADADVIFINGLNLEEFLAEVIENAGGRR